MTGFSNPASAPLGESMEAVVVFRDWFHQPTMETEPHLAKELANLKTRLLIDFVDSVSFEFLPLAILNASIDELRILAEDPLIECAIAAPEGWKRYRQTYMIVLNALNALRSQTGHQVFEWHLHLHDGEVLPHNDFEGGWLPPRGGYPRLKDHATGEIYFDEALVMGAPPAWMPIINLSIGPPVGALYEPYDPVSLAIATMSSTHLLVVAAGNDGVNGGPLNPWAVSEGALAVGATSDKQGSHLADSSSRGTTDGTLPGPDLVAWGQASSGDFGTSYAAPRVARMGVLCAALIAQVQHAWLLARDRRDVGVPLMGWGMVDASNQIPDLPERLDSPALPILAVRLDPMTQGLTEVDIRRIHLIPSVIRDIILDSTQAMPGYQKHEVGAGYIREDILVGGLAKKTVEDVIMWFEPQVQLPKHIAREPAFDRDELWTLAKIVRRTAPTWFWDIQSEMFIVNNRAVPSTSSDPDSFIKGNLMARRAHGGHGREVADAGREG